MRVSEAWLRTWIDPPLDLEGLCHTLTMLGLEVGAIERGKEKQGFFEIELTPNRGDCASILGIARELAAVCQIPYCMPTIVAPVPINTHSIQAKSISIPKEVQAACPYYCFAVLSHLDTGVSTPTWIKASLEGAGIATHQLVVDVLNFVMLELGQPLHAFDLAGFTGDLNVSFARSGETLTLLDEQKILLQENTLVIRDQVQPLAIAGIMGAKASAVQKETTAFLIESAWFTKEAMAGKARQYGLHTESSYRFERGIDPQVVRLAQDRVCQLLIELGGCKLVQRGERGAPCDPFPTQISFAPSLVNQLLGTQDTPEMIAEGFHRLGFKIVKQAEPLWTVSIPSYRQDMAIAEDLVEEHARLWGLDRITPQLPKLSLKAMPNHRVEKTRALKRVLIAQGLQEVVNYSFVDPTVQSLLSTEQELALSNPIADNLAVMRTTLWTGLLQTLAYHQNRQQARVRLFETGTCFHGNKEPSVVAGLITGQRDIEQWHAQKVSTDFFDLKAVVEALIFGMGQREALTYQPKEHIALHPGMSAAVSMGGKSLGVLGALHPLVLSQLKLEGPVWLFELALDPLLEPTAARLCLEVIPKFPYIRRDLALLVPDHLQAAGILDSISTFIGASLQRHCLFDVYRGQGVPTGFCSMAVSLIFQEPNRTLVDTEVEVAIQGLLIFLKEKYGVILR